MRAVRPHRGKGIFVTGADTGVGKTLVAAALARLLRERGADVAVAKPFLTGGDPAAADSDTSILIRLSGTEAQPEDVTFCWFPEPVSPYAAQRTAQRMVDVDAVYESLAKLISAREFTVVEGVGGALAPIAAGATVRDFILRLGLPALVVARAGLGTLNHTLLTVESLRSRGIAVEAVILNADRDYSADASAASNKEILEEFLGGIPVYGPLPHVEAPAANFDRFFRESRPVLEELCARICKYADVPDARSALECDNLLSLPADYMRGQVSRLGINSRRNQSGDESPHSKYVAEFMKQST